MRITPPPRQSQVRTRIFPPIRAITALSGREPVRVAHALINAHLGMLMLLLPHDQIIDQCSAKCSLSQRAAPVHEHSIEIASLPNLTITDCEKTCKICCFFTV